MNIKVDENLPSQLALKLQNLGHDVCTVQDEGLLGSMDGEIWEAVESESRFLITQDLDFSDIRKFPLRAGSGVLLIRLRTPSRQNLIACVDKIFRTESVAEWQGCIVVATERKTRILKPER